MIIFSNNSLPPQPYTRIHIMLDIIRCFIMIQMMKLWALIIAILKLRKVRNV